MQTRQFTAIPTRFEGVVYRSRLEARWAAFFELLGWKFEYEPFECEGWIPDFVLIGAKGNTLVEVKPRIDQIDFSKVKVDGYETLCVSAMPFSDFGAEFSLSVISPFGGRIFGLLVNEPVVSCAVARFVACDSDSSYDFMPRIGHPFGRITGITRRGINGWFPWDNDQTEGLWREAGNQTQWRPAR